MADERQEKTRAIDRALLTDRKSSLARVPSCAWGSKEAIVPIAVISTGSISFDAALGVGGFPPVGRVIEIFGPESSGKTTVAVAGDRRSAEDRGAMAGFC